MQTEAYIAFQGGGALGMAHLGAWQVLAQRFKFRGVAGTSAGSIVAALCAAGFDPAHAIEAFQVTKWNEFVKEQSNLSRILDGVWASIRGKQGLNDGENFRAWMLQRLATRFPDINAHRLTFDFLYKSTDVYLAIFACDINDPSAKPYIFDKESEPKVLVAHAVRASIAIPVIFTPVTRTDTGQTLIDGGILLNFPVEHLLSSAIREGVPLIGVRFDKPLAYLGKQKI